jgi:VCBS repeat-containing protein
VRTVTLGTGATVTTPWDPIRFELAPQAGNTSLVDIDTTRPGTQIRMTIDMRASYLDASTFNAYIKFVSQATITAAGSTPLTDLDGTVITSEGWYDFTQRTPGGDGARFIVDPATNKITAIALIITDNAFGDNDLLRNRIFDPGSPVNFNAAPIAADDTQTTNENTILNRSVPPAADSDGIASYTLVSDVGNDNGTLTFNPDGTYTFNPGTDFKDLNQGESRNVTFTYSATDNLGAVSDIKTVTFTVTGINEVQRPTPAILAPAFDCGAIGDGITAKGNAQLQLVASSGSAGLISLKGPDGTTLIAGSNYTIREIALLNKPGQSVYILNLADANLNQKGNQLFGTYNQGKATGNPASGLNGVYSILFDDLAVDTFELRTSPAAPTPSKPKESSNNSSSKSSGKSSNKQSQSSSQLLTSSSSSASQSSGDKSGSSGQVVDDGCRTTTSKGTNGNDNLLGSATKSDTLTGLDGSDLINGMGDRLTGSTFNPGLARKQIDTVTGGKGADWFQLGDIAGSFYAQHGTADYALIKDFSSDDHLLLHGRASDYQLTSSNGQLRLSILGTGGQPDDLVAIIQGTAIAGLTDLTNASQITFL